jgi:hypothetical protein
MDHKCTQVTADMQAIPHDQAGRCGAAGRRGDPAGAVRIGSTTVTDLTRDQEMTTGYERIN